MDSKKSLSNWLGLVKTAVHNHTEKRKMKNDFDLAYDGVRLAVSIYETYNTDLDKDLGKKWCEIKYCPEHWTGTLIEYDPNTQVHPCPYFTKEKCSRDCPKQQANHKFFDAKQAYSSARKAHIDSLRRVFGLRVK